MNITLTWLENHLNIGHLNFTEKITQLSDVINSIGMELDSITLCSMLLVGKVTFIEPIPKTKLYRCIVSVSELISRINANISSKYIGQIQEEYIILTTLTDIKQDTYMAFTPYNNHSPNGILIEKRPMMGHLSEGMFHVDSNNTLYDKCDILYIDAILNISINTNRPDLKFVRGIARDISTKLGTLKPLPYDEKIHNLHPICYALDININNQFKTFIDSDIDWQYEGYHTREGYKKALCKSLPEIHDSIETYITSLNETLPYKSVNNNEEIFLSHSLFYRMTSFDLSLYDISHILEKSGFKTSIVRKKSDDVNTVHDSFGINCIAPIWRSDIEYDMYVIHEIIRLHGMKCQYKPKPKGLIMHNSSYGIRYVLTSCGFTELYNFPFIDKNIYDNCVYITNLSSNNILRDTLLFSLLKNAQFIFSHNEFNAKIYEIGRVYPSEEERIGILISGYEPASILGPKRQLIHTDLHNIINICNLNIHKCNSIECHHKLSSWKDIAEDIAGCYCNFILRGSQKLGRSNKTYYYYESNIKQKPYVNFYTNSMEKTYTNINIESDTLIKWENITGILKKYEHTLVSSILYNNKYITTVNIAYCNSEEYSDICALISTLQQQHIRI